VSDINHKVESERIMSLLGENVIALEGQTDATMIATAIDALRHATLYAGEQTAELVKQQRIANLIALWTVSESDAEALTRDGVNFGRMIPEIREGLGLS